MTAENSNLTARDIKEIFNEAQKQVESPKTQTFVNIFKATMSHHQRSFETYKKMAEHRGIAALNIAPTPSETNRFKLIDAIIKARESLIGQSMDDREKARYKKMLPNVAIAYARAYKINPNTFEVDDTSATLKLTDELKMTFNGKGTTQISQTGILTLGEANFSIVSSIDPNDPRKKLDENTTLSGIPRVSVGRRILVIKNQELTTVPFIQLILSKNSPTTNQNESSLPSVEDTWIRIEGSEYMSEESTKQLNEVGGDLLRQIAVGNK